MSITHSMVFTFCKKGKRRYVSGQDQNYPARRAEEENRTALLLRPGPSVSDGCRRAA